MGNAHGKPKIIAIGSRVTIFHRHAESLIDVLQKQRKGHLDRRIFQIKSMRGYHGISYIPIVFPNGATMGVKGR
jgi:hypothetical protein